VVTCAKKYKNLQVRRLVSGGSNEQMDGEAGIADGVAVLSVDQDDGGLVGGIRRERAQAPALGPRPGRPSEPTHMCAGININRSHHVRVLPFVTGNTG
jgi:hypothetical protein